MSAADLALFAPGCVVRLKGQDVPMTILPPGDGATVRCAYRVADGSFDIMAFPIACLEPCESVEQYATRAKGEAQ